MWTFLSSSIFRCIGPSNSRVCSTLIDHVYISERLSHSPCDILPPLSGSDHSMTTMSKTTPTKLIKSSNNIPYLSHDLTRLIHKKHRLFKLAKRLNSDHAWLKYSKARNKLTSALRAAKAQYLENLSSAIRSPRDFSVSYHKLSPKRQRIATDLKYNSHSASTSFNKANLLNQFFKSCFTCSTLPLCADISQPLASRSGPLLSNISCSQEEVLDLLSTYKLKTAAGPDSVSSRMLQETARSISPSLTELFNLSLKKAKVPDQWKISNITPIFKSGDPSSALNYHPISLLPLISKILERIIHSRLMNYLQTNRLLSSCQYGFRPRSSTQEALLCYKRLASHAV